MLFHLVRHCNSSSLHIAGAMPPTFASEKMLCLWGISCFGNRNAAKRLFYSEVTCCLLLKPVAYQHTTAAKQ